MTIEVMLTPEQATVIESLDRGRLAGDILQAHVNTWLAPMMQEAARDEQSAVLRAFVSADATVRGDVKRTLGMDRVDANAIAQR